MANRKKNRKGVDAAFAIKGMFRVQIVGDRAEIIGDSEWRRNVVTSMGLQYMMKLLTNAAATEQLSTVALGTGTHSTNGGVVYTSTDLPGCVDPIDYTKLTVAIGSTVGAASTDWSTLQFRATFASGWNSTDGAPGSNINNVGIYDSDGGPGGVFFAGNSFPMSNCATNQAVNVTYNLLLGSQ